MGSESILILTEENFSAEVLESDLPVLVDFWAEWCGPCRMMSPVVDRLAGEYAGRVKVGKLNVDEQRAVADKYGIRSIPTFLIFKHGEERERLIGAVPEAKLKEALDRVL